MNDHVTEELEAARDSGLSRADRIRADTHLATCADCRRYAAELERNDALLSRPERPMPLPPMTRRQRGIAWAPAAAIGLAALALVTAIGVARDGAGRPSLGPPTLNRPTPAVPVETMAPATASPTATPTLSGDPEAVTGVSAHPLGTLQGDWVFAARTVGIQTEIWAIPFTGGAPRLAMSYAKSRGGVPESLIEFRPHLRRAFSPDGRRMVVSTDKQLVVVDLVSGQARGLGIGGEFAAWSRSGDAIAFVHDEPNPDPQNASPVRGVWTISASGGQARRVAAGTYPLEWSNDTRLIARDENGLIVIDTATGRTVRLFPGQLGGSGISPVFWRRGSAEIAAIFHVGDREELVLYDADTGARRVLASGPGVNFDDPRWSPTGADLVLLTETSSDRTTAAHRVHAVDLAGRDTTYALNAMEATWTPDGLGIVFIDVGTGVPPIGRVVRVFDRASGSTRDLLTAAGPFDYMLSVASVSY